ncbi:hypothetical protein ES703_79658 [subsurface metagenome]
MVKCSFCGKEFKNDSGLSGHMRFSHPSAIEVDGHKLEARLEAVELALKSMPTSPIDGNAIEARLGSIEGTLKVSDRGSKGLFDEILKTIDVLFARLKEIDATLKFNNDTSIVCFDRIQQTFKESMASFVLHLEADHGRHLDLSGMPEIRAIVDERWHESRFLK